MARPILSDSGQFRRPATLTWLNRFEVCLEAECLELFGLDWLASVEPDEHKITFRRRTDGATVRAELHPGMHVVAPFWAAQRLADQLQMSAIMEGLIPPPRGASSSTEH